MRFDLVVEGRVQVTMPVLPLAVVPVIEEGVDRAAGLRSIIRGSTLMKKHVRQQVKGKDNAEYNLGMRTRRMQVRAIAFV